MFNAKIRMSICVYCFNFVLIMFKLDDIYREGNEIVEKIVKFFAY